MKKTIILSACLFNFLIISAQNDTLVPIEKYINRDTIIYYNNGSVKTKINVINHVKYTWEYLQSGVLLHMIVSNNTTTNNFHFDCNGSLYSYEYTKKNKITRIVYSSNSIPVYISYKKNKKEKVLYIDAELYPVAISVENRFYCFPHWKK